MPDDFGESEETKMPCPAGCESGVRVSRLETKSGHRIRSFKCAYCEGTGLVSSVRHAAFLRLTRDGSRRTEES